MHTPSLIFPRLRSDGKSDAAPASTATGRSAARDPSRPLRTLLIAESANPVLTSASLVGWSMTRALAKVTEAHVLTEWRNRDDFLKAGLVEGVDFTAINVRRSQHFAWLVGNFGRKGKDIAWARYSAAATLVYPFFERAIWKQFREPLLRGEFDLVHRVLPLAPVTPSWIAKKLAHIGVPFVLGPLNGGVPWPEPFKHLGVKESDFTAKLRGLSNWIPGARSTRRNASAIIAGSRTTFRQLPEQFHEKTVFIPENAIDLGKFPMSEKPAPSGPLKVAFVGRLVALKGVDMIIEAAAPLVREGRLQLDIIGDGPERARLQEMAAAEGIAGSAKIEGWVPHGELSSRLRESDVLAFPSVREFGGGAVLEAMALGLVPVVLDHGGPVELVPPQTGFVLPMTSRENIVKLMRDLFVKLADHPEQLVPMGRNAQSHIRQHYTWERKAAQVLEVYDWVLGRRDSKPGWGMPFDFVS